MRLSSLLRHASALVFACGISASCSSRNRSDDTPAPVPPEVMPPGVTVEGLAVPREHTRVLSAEGTAAIETFDLAAGVLMLKASGDVPAAFAAGDVIVARIGEKTPSGALVKVVTAAQEGGLWRLSVSQASLADALESANFSVKIALDPAKAIYAPQLSGASVVKTPAAGGVPLLGDESGFTLGMTDVPVLDVDGDTATTYDQVQMTASLFFDLGLDLTLRTGTLSIDELTVAVRGKESGTVELKGEAAAAFSKKVAVGVMVFPPIVVPVGAFPLVLTSGIDLTMGVGGAAVAKFRTSASEEASFRVGAGYLAGGVQLIKEGAADGSFQAPTIAGTQVEAKASLGARASLALYGVAGGYAGAGAFATVRAEPAADLSACATAQVGVEAEAGLKAGIFGLKIADWSDTITFLEKDLGIKACNAKGGTGEDATLGWRYVADGAEDDKVGFVTAAASRDGGMVLARSGNSFGYVQKHDAEGVVDWRYGMTGGTMPSIDRLAVAANGDVLAVGTYGSRLAVLRLDGAGRLLWAKSIDRQAVYFVNALAEASDGAILVAGKTYDGDDTSDDAFLLRLDAAGAVLSFSRLKGPIDLDGANAVAAGPDGRAYLAGTTRAPSGDTTKFLGFVAAIAADGSTVWAKGVAAGEATALAADGSGGVVVAGFEERFADDALTKAPWAVRVDADGARSWGTELALNVRPTAIGKTKDGAVVSGVSTVAADDLRGFVLRLGDGGGVLWARTYRTAAVPQELSLIYERADERIVAGGHRVPGARTTEAWWLTLPRDGSGSGAPAGSEATTASASTIALADVVDVSFTVVPLTTDVTALDVTWSKAVAPEPSVLSAP